MALALTYVPAKWKVQTFDFSTMLLLLLFCFAAATLVPPCSYAAGLRSRTEGERSCWTALSTNTKSTQVLSATTARLYTVREVVVIFPSQPFPHSPYGFGACRATLLRIRTAPSNRIYEASLVRCKISSTVDKI